MSPRATCPGPCRATSCPMPPLAGPPPPSQAGQPRWLWSEGHTAAQWGQHRVRDPTGMLGLSGTLKPPAMMLWGLLSLLLFTVASGTPIRDQDEDIQVQENFEAERVTAACGPLILGAEGWGKALFHFPPEGRVILSMPISGCVGQVLAV